MRKNNDNQQKTFYNNTIHYLDVISMPYDSMILEVNPWSNRNEGQAKAAKRKGRQTNKISSLARAINR